MTIRKKRKFKAIISTFLCLALLGGAVFGISKLLKNDSDTVEIKSSAFVVGGIDEEGKYVDNKHTLYTKEMFDCQGLKVDLDFDFRTSYQIFFYDYNGNFLESTDVLTSSFNDDLPQSTASARIMIIPEIPEGETEKDFKISFFEKHTYTKGITITVSSDQNIPSEFGTILYGVRYDSDGYDCEASDPFPIIEDSRYNSSELLFLVNSERDYVITNIGDNPITILHGMKSLSEIVVEPGDTYIIEGVDGEYYYGTVITYLATDKAPLLFSTSSV